MDKTANINVQSGAAALASQCNQTPSGGRVGLLLAQRVEMKGGMAARATPPPPTTNHIHALWLPLRILGPSDGTGSAPHLLAPAPDSEHTSAI
jgi:hypothetical protein